LSLIYNRDVDRSTKTMRNDASKREKRRNGEEAKRIKRRDVPLFLCFLFLDSSTPRL